MHWIQYLGAIVAAYLLGSVPMGYLIVKLTHGIDIRTVGSGRTGGSNVLRAAGILPAAFTVLGDFAKGYGSVLITRLLIPNPAVVTAVAAVAALASVAGHNWSIFLQFRGGVGTITSLGAAMALGPVGAAIAGLAAIVAVGVSRYTSLGSLTFAAALPVTFGASALLRAWVAPTLVFAVGASIVAVWQLRPNIARLLAGSERRLGQFIRSGKTDVEQK